MTQNPKFVFIMGGPGCGKGTTCEILSKDNKTSVINGKSAKFIHLCAGDLLRNVASGESPGTDLEVQEKVKNLLKNGMIVPSEITFQLMKDEITKKEEAKPDGVEYIYLLDGYPRRRDQGDWFEHAYGPAYKVIHLSCSFPVLERRLISRQSATKHVAKGGSPRCDDIPALVHKRILVHEQDCLPVIESYEAENRLLTIRCDNKNIDEVVQATRELILQQ